MNKKYELIPSEVFENLYRIKALNDFADVKKGDLGGFVASEDNLSQEGTCWVYGNARVSDNARVYENAVVGDNARVFDNAQVYGNAKVVENAKVDKNARVYGAAMVFGKAIVSDNARVYDTAIVYGNTVIGDYAKVSWNTKGCEYSMVYDKVGDRSESPPENTTNEFSPIVNPKHYQILPEKEVEVRDVINGFLKKMVQEGKDIDHLYDWSNAIKYLLRAPFKNDVIEDLEKNEFCVETLLESYRNKEEK